MTRKSWHLDRRTLLRGAGVACALPTLEGMERAIGRAPSPTAGEPPRRLCFVYFPNGAALPSENDAENRQWRWFPDDPGPDYRFTKVLQPLAPHREHLSILGGLSHPLSRELLGHLAGDTWLTAGDLRGDKYLNRESVDQVAARHLKKHTRYPSMVLSTDGGVGYKSRISTLSFDSTGRPIPSEHRHRAIFERYFSPSGGATTEERRRSLAQGRKIVDLILEDSKRLKGRLSRKDQEKLDDYLASLNSVEEQVRRNEAWLDVPLPEVDGSHLQLDANPKADPTAYLRCMFDLIVLALQTDMTRAITYMTGREDGMGFADNFPSLTVGVKKGHHTISHDQAKGHWPEWGRYDRWHAEQFGYFLQRLTETEDAHGPLIESTAVLYGSCCSTTHNARNYPLALAGGRAMGLRHGHYRVYDEATPFSNVLLTMLRAVGVQQEAFADSTGALDELLPG